MDENYDDSDYPYEEWKENEWILKCMLDDIKGVLEKETLKTVRSAVDERTIREFWVKLREAKLT